MSLAQRVHTNKQNKSTTNTSKNANFELLKSQVQSSVSMDKLAVAMVENPRLAKNEIRRQCNTAFEQKCWENISEQTREELILQVINNVFGLGPLEDLIADEEITEVMVNGPDSVFYEKK